MHNGNGEAFKIIESACGPNKKEEWGWARAHNHASGISCTAATRARGKTHASLLVPVETSKVNPPAATNARPRRPSKYTSTASYEAPAIVRGPNCPPAGHAAGHAATGESRSQSTDADSESAAHAQSKAEKSAAGIPHKNGWQRKEVRKCMFGISCFQKHARTSARRRKRARLLRAASASRAAAGASRWPRAARAARSAPKVARAARAVLSQHRA